MPPADVVELPARGDHGLACLFAINHPNTRSDSQPKSGRCNLPRNLSPDVATFTRTRHRPPPLPNRLSRPLEDCEGCPVLAGVRNLGLDDPSAGVQIYI